MSQKALRFVQRALQIAAVCGAVPLTAALLAYLTWITLEWDQMSSVAFYVAILDILLLIAGFVALAGAFIVARKIRVLDQPAFRKGATMAFTLLALNIPTGIMLTVAGVDSYFSYRLTLTNRTERDYPEAQLLIRDRKIPIPIKKGETVKQKLADLPEASLSLQLTPDSEPVEIEGYVTGGMPRNRVVIHPDGSIFTRHTSRESQQALPTQRSP